MNSFKNYLIRNLKALNKKQPDMPGKIIAHIGSGPRKNKKAGTIPYSQAGGKL